MLDRPISEKDSLLLIGEMIRATKARISEDGFLYLLWGWLVLAASLGQFVLLQLDYKYHDATWSLMFVGAAISIAYALRKSKTKPVTTYVDEFMAYVWGAFIVTLVTVLVYMSKIGPANAYPVILLLYGIATFVSGGALKFRPLSVTPAWKSF